MSILSFVNEFFYRLSMVFFSRLSMVFNVCQKNIPRFNICQVLTFVGSSGDPPSIRLLPNKSLTAHISRDAHVIGVIKYSTIEGLFIIADETI